MDNAELISKLTSLAQLDVDAVDVYREALAGTTDEEVHKNFERFQGEHEYHSTKLLDAVVALGAPRPELKVDLLGHVADLVTSLRSRGGTRGALHAMLTAERYHNSRYAAAASWDVSDADLATQLGRFRDDERRHLEYVETHLGDTGETS